MELDFPEQVEINYPICHQSINSRAAVLFEIRKSEQCHWFSGLRTAEMFVRSKQEALLQSQFNLRQYARELRKKTRRLSELEQLDADRTLDQMDETEELEDELAIARHHYEVSAIQFRDALMEQSTAQAEFDRIIGEHPEAKLLSYEELQERFTPVALAEAQARWLAARTWAATAGVPGEVGAAVFDLPPGTQPGQRNYALKREMEIRSDEQKFEQVFRAVEILSSLPPEEAQAILLQAAQDALTRKKLQEVIHE